MILLSIIPSHNEAKKSMNPHRHYTEVNIVSMHDETHWEQAPYLSRHDPCAFNSM